MEISLPKNGFIKLMIISSFPPIFSTTTEIIKKYHTFNYLKYYRLSSMFIFNLYNEITKTRDFKYFKTKMIVDKIKHTHTHLCKISTFFCCFSINMRIKSDMIMHNSSFIKLCVH